MKSGKNMEKDLDIELYNEYLDGNKEAFETLYNKYERKIQYFIYNIVKDYQRAEDITQDVFIYVMQNRIKQGYTFKYYIYLVAKSRAYNHINTEKNRIKINEQSFKNMYYYFMCNFYIIWSYLCNNKDYRKCKRKGRNNANI